VLNTVELTKSERKKLRELASAAYEADACRLLEELDAEFARWRKGEIPSSELFSAVHEFHQHKSREFWSMYQGLSDELIVQRAVSLGFVAEGSIPEAILAKLQTRPLPDRR